MDTELKQYFIYGVLAPYSWYVEKNTQYTEWLVNNDEAITTSPLFDVDMVTVNDTRNGDSVIIGRIIGGVNGNNPVIVPEMTEADKYIIEHSINYRFGGECEFHVYYVINS